MRLHWIPVQIRRTFPLINFRQNFYKHVNSWQKYNFNDWPTAKNEDEICITVKMCVHVLLLSMSVSVSMSVSMSVFVSVSMTMSILATVSVSMSMPVREIGMLPKMISTGCQLKTVLRNVQEGD
jgi:hypothetical protein